MAINLTVGLKTLSANLQANYLFVGRDKKHDMHSVTSPNEKEIKTPAKMPNRKGCGFARSNFTVNHMISPNLNATRMKQP